MPFDEPLVLPPTARVEPSAVIELSWCVIACGKRNAVRLISPELEAEADAFWDDGHGMLTEPLVIAQQLGCLTGWDIEPLLSISKAKLDASADMNLSTEPEAERVVVRERVARLARDVKLRRRYERFLRKVWAVAQPALREVGRSAVDRAVQRARASMEHGQSPLELIGGDHIALRQKFEVLTERALEDGSLLLTPCYIAGGHGHIVALPGLLSVAIGTGVTSDIARNRATAEGVARDLKLLSDPTRVLILTELDRTPATVGEIARRVGVAQPTASVHVRQLRDAGLLRATRDGASSSYRVDRSRLRDALRGAQEALLPATTGS
ncbi:MAG TPA: metalloregulator ArsR/SmtB family transcription factor [Gaiellales bacterium]|nr:metalloregulator ArsR/SmtB family transcription factor [Gaiellales bacterium]